MDRASSIDNFLADCEESDSIVDYIRQEHEKLVDEYGYRVINDIENACCLQMASTDEDEYKKAVSKLTKATILEISATVAFLAGMVACYEKLKQK